MTVRPSRSEASMSTPERAGNRKSREVAERDDEAGDRSSRSGGETHRDLADAFGLQAQRRRHGAGEHRAPTHDARVPPKPEERGHPGHRPAVRPVQESAAEPSPDEKDRALAGVWGPPPRPTRLASPRATFGCSSPPFRFVGAAVIPGSHFCRTRTRDVSPQDLKGLDSLTEATQSLVVRAGNEGWSTYGVL
jgi:hypothetical protein